MGLTAGGYYLPPLDDRARLIGVGGTRVELATSRPWRTSALNVPEGSKLPGRPRRGGHDAGRMRRWPHTRLTRTPLLKHGG